MILPFDMMGAASLPSPRITVMIGGMPFREIVKMHVDADLKKIAHSFHLEIRDAARALATLPWTCPLPGRGPMVCGERTTILIDGEIRLVGWVDSVEPSLQEGKHTHVTLVGRDVTGDLVDCAAAPKGPTEYKNVTILELAQKICKPFDIDVRAEVDVGKPFDKVCIDAGETAMSAIEKYARKRALLVTSDGVGALVLTRSGRTRAAGPVVVPGNASRAKGKLDWSQRFSDYYVKGQTHSANGARPKQPKLDADTRPLEGDNNQQNDSSSGTTGGEDEGGMEGRGVSIQGLAHDDEITRYRPTVLMCRTESSQVDAETYAKWAMKTRKAKSTKLDYQLEDFRINGALWKLNQLTEVNDSYENVFGDMLISSLEQSYDDKGDHTRLRLVGPEAYDPEPGQDGGNSGGGGGKSGGGGVDRSAYGLG